MVGKKNEIKTKDNKSLLQGERERDGEKGPIMLCRIADRGVLFVVLGE